MAEEHVTRNAVLKSTVVITDQPLYGVVQRQLSAATEAFFAQRNFSETAIMQQLYRSLGRSLHTVLKNREEYVVLHPVSVPLQLCGQMHDFLSQPCTPSFGGSLLPGLLNSYLYEGLDCRGLVLKFRHKLLQLYKLLFLERR